MLAHGKPFANTAAKRVFACHAVHGEHVQHMAVELLPGNSRERP